MHLHLQENANIKLLHKRAIHFSNLRYETMVKNRDATVAHFFNRLGITRTLETNDSPVVDELQKVGDQWNEETERRFRTERSESVAEFEASRLIHQLRPEDIAI